MDSKLYTHIINRHLVKFVKKNLRIEQNYINSRQRCYKHTHKICMQALNSVDLKQFVKKRFSSKTDAVRAVKKFLLQVVANEM